MNYTELVEAIQSFSANSESGFTDQINNFIQAAESKIFMAMRGPLAWKASTTETFTSGQPLQSMPNGTIDIVDLYVIGPDANTDGRFLLRKDHAFLLEYSPLRDGVTTTGMPRYYSVEAGSHSSGTPTLQIRVAPAPDIAYKFSVAYYGRSVADSITNGATPAAPTTTSTWLSAAFPDVLLYGSLLNAAIFMKGEQDVIAAYQQQFNEGVTMLKNMTENRQGGDEYSDMGKADSAL